MNKQIITIQEYDLPVTIMAEKEGGFVAVCPVWQAVYAQGETIEEAIAEITAVATTMIEVYKEEQMAIPLKAKKSVQQEKKTFTITFPLVVSTS